MRPNEPVSAHCRTSLSRSDTDIENCRAETRGRKTPFLNKNSRNLQSETQPTCPKPREYRRFSDAGHVRDRDRSGWLGRQDSNLGMAESKSAALPLGYAPSQGPRSRPDDSDEGRTDQRPSRLRAPGTRGYISASGKYRSVAQPGSAPRSGRGGRRFKSCHSDQYSRGLKSRPSSKIPQRDRKGDRNAILAGRCCKTDRPIRSATAHLLALPRVPLR